jgi:hypothetical protein
MSLVELRINRTKTGQHFSSINVNFDQENEGVVVGASVVGASVVGASVV